MIILDVEGKCKGFFEKNRKKLKGGSRSGIISNIWASILSKNGGYRVSMIKIKDYVRVGSLEEAYELNQKRSACILGGMLWTKMGQRQVQTAIDLSGLGLDQIEESEEEFSIGCMVTLRQLEEHEGLNAYTDGAAVWQGGVVDEEVEHGLGLGVSAGSSSAAAKAPHLAGFRHTQTGLPPRSSAGFPGWPWRAGAGRSFSSSGPCCPPGRSARG